MPKRTPILGCIADDVTGATDLAINLVQGGMCVVQLLEIPTVEEIGQIDADAIVVALKTRSIAKDEAIRQSRETLHVFRELGIDRYFFKYCSTFDSTEEGNIGPVASALLDELNATQTIFCPAFPRNGRTVYQGHLFVRDRLLSESGMESHPLNPMTDANLVRFLGKQCERDVGLLNFENLQTGTARNRLRELAAQGCPFVITDACHDEHLQVIAAAVADLPLVTGGSGIARFLPRAYRDAGLFRATDFAPQAPQIAGRSLIVAGSCSHATNQQVAQIRNKVPHWKIDVDQVVRNPEAARNDVIQWARTIPPAVPAMIYSTAPPETVSEIQNRHGARTAAQATEAFLADVVALLVSEHHLSRLILAGGETAGAVVKALGVRSLRIGPEICAGVPWTESLGERRLALALKSGNFGDEDFFEQALRMLP